MANQDMIPSSRAEIVPDRGRVTTPNLGEYSSALDAAKLPPYSLGVIPARGNRAGGGQQIDLGAQVGVMLNLEFSAGGRAHRLITGTFDTARPSTDPRSGQIITSSSGGTELSVGRAGSSQIAMPPAKSPQRAERDNASGPASPERRRDKHTP